MTFEPEASSKCNFCGEGWFRQTGAGSSTSTTPADGSANASADACLLAGKYGVAAALLGRLPQRLHRFSSPAFVLPQ
jgi:hypothetical protein